MKITLDEFEAFFNGGLTQARRDELFVAIFTNAECMRLASAFLIFDDLESLSSPQQQTDVSFAPPIDGGTIPRSSDERLTSSSSIEALQRKLEKDRSVEEFRHSIAKANITTRKRDEILVKRVQRTYIISKEVIFTGDSEVAFMELLMVVEPVVQFWSKHFDNGMFSPGTARSCAHRLLRKPKMSLYKNYNPELGSFSTYFEQSLRNELKSVLRKELRESFSGKREENYETTPKEYVLIVNGAEDVDGQMLRVDGKSVIEKIKNVLEPEEWSIFAGRYMYGEKLKEIAKQYKCSESRVSRITRAAMTKIRMLQIV